MKILRGHIVCRELRWRMPAKEFKKHNYGWSRTEVVHKLLAELEIEVTGFGSVQVIPAGDDYVIVLRQQ